MKYRSVEDAVRQIEKERGVDLLGYTLGKATECDFDAKDAFREAERMSRMHYERKELLTTCLENRTIAAHVYENHGHFADAAISLDKAAKAAVQLHELRFSADARERSADMFQLLGRNNDAVFSLIQAAKMHVRLGLTDEQHYGKATNLLDEAVATCELDHMHPNAMEMYVNIRFRIQYLCMTPKEIADEVRTALTNEVDAIDLPHAGYLEEIGFTSLASGFNHVGFIQLAQAIRMYSQGGQLREAIGICEDIILEADRYEGPAVDVFRYELDQLKEQ